MMANICEADVIADSCTGSGDQFRLDNIQSKLSFDLALRTLSSILDGFEKVGHLHRIQRHNPNESKQRQPASPGGDEPRSVAYGN